MSGQLVKPNWVIQRDHISKSSRNDLQVGGCTHVDETEFAEQILIREIFPVLVGKLEGTSNLRTSNFLCSGFLLFYGLQLSDTEYFYTYEKKELQHQTHSSAPVSSFSHFGSIGRDRLRWLRTRQQLSS